MITGWGVFSCHGKLLKVCLHKQAERDCRYYVEKINKTDPFQQKLTYKPVSITWDEDNANL
jgi:hypothetical protein